MIQVSQYFVNTDKFQAEVYFPCKFELRSAYFFLKHCFLVSKVMYILIVPGLLKIIPLLLFYQTKQLQEMMKKKTTTEPYYSGKTVSSFHEINKNVQWTAKSNSIQTNALTCDDRQLESKETISISQRIVISRKKRYVLEVLDRIGTKIQRQKRFSFQLFKQFSSLYQSDSWQSQSVSSAGGYYYALCHEEVLHTFLKIYETRETANILWAFLNLKMLNVRKKMEKFVEIVETSEANITFRNLNDSFQSIKKQAGRKKNTHRTPQFNAYPQNFKYITKDKTRQQVSHQNAKKPSALVQSHSEVQTDTTSVKTYGTQKNLDLPPIPERQEKQEVNVGKYAKIARQQEKSPRKFISSAMKQKQSSFKPYKSPDMIQTKKYQQTSSPKKFNVIESGAVQNIIIKPQKKLTITSEINREIAPTPTRSITKHETPTIIKQSSSMIPTSESVRRVQYQSHTVPSREVKSKVISSAVRVIYPQVTETTETTKYIRSDAKDTVQHNNATKIIKQYETPVTIRKETVPRQITKTNQQSRTYIDNNTTRSQITPRMQTQEVILNKTVPEVIHNCTCHCQQTQHCSRQIQINCCCQSYHQCTCINVCRNVCMVCSGRCACFSGKTAYWGNQYIHNSDFQSRIAYMRELQVLDGRFSEQS